MYSCFYIASLLTRGIALAKSIMVSEETHRKLVVAKMELGFKSMDDMLARLVSEIAKARFPEASAHFRAALKRRRLSLGEVTTSGEAIRIELFRKWFRREQGHS